MKLLLLHPQILNRSCARCRRWMYDDQHRLVRRAGQRVPRPPQSPPPCWKCPKQSPAQAQGCERDMDRIQRTLAIYFEVRATAGRSLSECQAADPLLARHLAIVDALVRRYEQTGLKAAQNGEPHRLASGWRAD